MTWLDTPDGVLAFVREPGFVCLVDLSAEPYDLPAHSGVLLASGPLEDGRLGTDQAVWPAVRPRTSPPCTTLHCTPMTLPGALYAPAQSFCFCVQPRTNDFEEGPYENRVGHVPADPQRGGPAAGRPQCRGAELPLRRLARPGRAAPHRVRHGRGGAAARARSGLRP
ncbi:hypothetical protein [Streptomyces massasporeus]|uniref:hypothetical protein n=1 Tax=Streptomyces massasporeus TaxID=67324 RepID=UPI003659E1C3